jgi:hypothetical protein
LLYDPYPGNVSKLQIWTVNYLAYGP